MKLTNLALLGAIFGPNATSATDAITGINDPLKLKRKLSSSSSSSTSTSSGSTKSAKISKSAGVDYRLNAEGIIDGSGCDGKSCGTPCYTIKNAEAVYALEGIARGSSSASALLATVSYGLGVCDTNSECAAVTPSAETDDGDIDALTLLLIERLDECGVGGEAVSTITEIVGGTVSKFME